MVGKNIKRFREEKKMTQDELADKLCVTRQAISNWERGTTEPDIDTLDTLAQALEVTVEELIYGSKKTVNTVKIEKSATVGVTFGSALALVISYVKWQSIGWALLHGGLGWIYVIYYIIKYGWS